jgi:hypothetical protein
MKPFSTLLLLIPLTLALPTPPPSSTDISSVVDHGSYGQSTNYKRADDADYGKYVNYGKYDKYSTYNGYDESTGSAGK